MVTEIVPLNSGEELSEILSSSQKYITFNFIILAYSRKRFINQTRKKGLKIKSNYILRAFPVLFTRKIRTFHKKRYYLLMKTIVLFDGNDSTF